MHSIEFCFPGITESAPAEVIRLLHSAKFSVLICLYLCWKWNLWSNLTFFVRLILFHTINFLYRLRLLFVLLDIFHITANTSHFVQFSKSSYLFFFYALGYTQSHWSLFHSLLYPSVELRKPQANMHWIN